MQAGLSRVGETEDASILTEGLEFSIEMETGTGKTYVYLRSIFELNQAYGFKKFIIVVPSVAIREGVLKSIDMMKEHFQTLYEKTPFDHFVYDSKRLGKVRQFATSNQIQIMVINIQSFQKDVADKDLSEMTDEELKKLNVINRENDRMSGQRPIEFIQAANPIVIIDEPQSVDNTEKSRRGDPQSQSSGDAALQRNAQKPLQPSLQTRPYQGLRSAAGEADRGRLYPFG